MTRKQWAISDIVGGSRRIARLAAAVDPMTILAALPDPIILIDKSNFILWINSAGENFVGASALTLRGSNLSDLLPGDSPLFSLIASVRDSGATISESSAVTETPRLVA